VHCRSIPIQKCSNFSLSPLSSITSTTLSHNSPAERKWAGGSKDSHVVAGQANQPRSHHASERSATYAERSRTRAGGHTKQPRGLAVTEQAAGHAGPATSSSCERAVKVLQPNWLEGSGGTSQVLSSILHDDEFQVWGLKKTLRLSHAKVQICGRPVSQGYSAHIYG
jgi:hypothetical protein